MLEATKSCQTSDAHVAMVGIRAIDDAEQAWLDEGVIQCMKMDAVHERGLQACMFNAVATANQAEAGFGLTIDIDAIDPSQAPFVATQWKMASMRTSLQGFLDNYHIKSDYWVWKWLNLHPEMMNQAMRIEHVPSLCP